MSHVWRKQLASKIHHIYRVIEALEYRPPRLVFENETGRFSDTFAYSIQSWNPKEHLKENKHRMPQ